MRNIYMTQEQIELCRAEFEKALLKRDRVFGEFKFSHKITDADSRRAVVRYTPSAWAKMSALVMKFDKEIAWNGVAKREDPMEDGRPVYKIYDVLVCPQEVTGATVDTDQSEFEEWLMGLDDETFNNLRFQAHSHVNMEVSPSAVDMEHQRKITEQLEDDMFYIFQIWNKQLKIFTRIYDMRENAIFDTGDVDLEVEGIGFSIDEFCTEANKLVKNKTHQSYTTSSYPSAYGSAYRGVGTYTAAGYNDTDKQSKSKKDGGSKKYRSVNGDPLGLYDYDNYYGDYWG